MATYTLQRLSEQTGVPERTIRYYIVEGLIPKANLAGKDSTYSDDHLNRLKKIHELKQQGHSLAAIRVKMLAQDAPVKVVPLTLWTTATVHNVAPDVQVTIMSGVDPKRARVIERALKAFTKSLKES